MRLVSTDDLSKICRNNYEAVIVAAQYARRLNTARLNREQREDFEEDEVDRSRPKVTSQALYDLVDSKITFTRS